MLRQKRLNVGPEGTARIVGGGRREGEEVAEIGGDSPLHYLERSAVDHHSSGAWRQICDYNI